MGSYANNGLLIRVNAGMATQAGSTMVDWSGLNHEKFKGGIFRLGSIFGVADAQTQDADDFMDLSEKSNRVSMVQNKKLAIGYIDFDGGWALNRGWTAGSVENLLDGTIPEVAQKLVKYEPHIYLLARKLKQGAGRVFDASKLLGLPDWDADGIIWFIEKYWLENSKEIGDGWIARSLKVVLNGAKLLADNGYLPKTQINNQTIMSSEWFLANHGNADTRNVIANWDSIPQGNYWKQSKDGLKNCETAEELVSLIGTIPDTFSIDNVGAAFDPKIVLGYKLASNITMPQVLNSNGIKVPFDVISLRFPESVLFNRYPSYKTRMVSGSVVPPPIVIPPTNKEKYAKPITNVYLRKLPGKGNVLINQKVFAGEEKKILETKSFENGDIWHRVSTEGWICQKLGNEKYIDIIEK